MGGEGRGGEGRGGEGRGGEGRGGEEMEGWQGPKRKEKRVVDMALQEDKSREK